LKTEAGKNVVAINELNVQNADITEQLKSMKDLEKNAIENAKKMAELEDKNKDVKKQLDEMSASNEKMKKKETKSNNTKRLAEIWNEYKEEYMSSIKDEDDRNKYNRYVKFNEENDKLIIIDNNDKDSFPLCFIADINAADLDDDDANKKLAYLIDEVY
jgi:hypothetical protein